MKYMGSKAAIATSILSYIHSYIFLNNIDTYIEPFVGGANVIDKVQCTNKLAYDKNRYVIALYKHLQSNGELPEDVSRELYIDCRSHYYAKDGYYPDWYLAAVGFLAGYNGRFYDGGYGGTFKSEENNRNYYNEAKNNLLNQMKSLQDVKFEVSDYKDLQPKGALIYADPPYKGTKGYDTISKKFNHQQFWDKVREWSKDNIVLVSEEQAPEDFDIIWEQEVLRTVNNNISKQATEKLFIHSSLNEEQITEF